MMAPVFIVGCDRSGTTLLRLMLSMSPVLHIPRESGFIPELWERRGDYDDFSTERARWFFIRDLQLNPATSKTRSFDIFGISPEDASRELAAVSPTGYAGAIAALYRASASRAGKDRWGDKTPRNVLHLEFLGELFPDARFIHILRDPRDVTLSMFQAGWGQTARSAALFWRERVGAGRAAGRSLGSERYGEVSFESLVKDPVTELKSLCEWLDLPFDSRMLDFHEEGGQRVPQEHANLFRLVTEPVQPSRAGAWRRDMSRHDIADVEDVAGRLMVECGYATAGYRPALRRILLRRMLSALRPWAKRVSV